MKKAVIDNDNDDELDDRVMQRLLVWLGWADEV